jgi:hypothetical protein
MFCLGVVAQPDAIKLTEDCYTRFLATPPEEIE